MLEGHDIARLRLQLAPDLATPRAVFTDRSSKTPFLPPRRRRVAPAPARRPRAARRHARCWAPRRRGSSTPPWSRPRGLKSSSGSLERGLQMDEGARRGDCHRQPEGGAAAHGGRCSQRRRAGARRAGKRTRSGRTSALGACDGLEQSHANATCCAGEIGGGSTASFRCRRIFWMTFPAVIAAMIRSRPADTPGSVPCPSRRRA